MKRRIIYNPTFAGTEVLKGVGLGEYSGLLKGICGGRLCGNGVPTEPTTYPKEEQILHKLKCTRA